MSELHHPGENKLIRERANFRERKAPSVRIYDPTNREDHDQFISSLRQTMLRTSRGIISAASKRFITEESLIKKAISQGILVDTYPEFLEDKAKRLEGKEYYNKHPQELKDYISQRDTWENTRIVEFDWIEGKGRFKRIAKQDEYEEVVFSGNGNIILKELRDKLGGKRVAFAGAGVGSSLLEGALRVGVNKVNIADGGKILFHDHGRLQSPDLAAILDYHAVDAARKALEFNPYIDINCYPKNIGLEDTDTTVSIDTFLNGVDIVFEEIDNLQMKILIREEARRRGIPVVMFTDAGKGTKIDYQPGDYNGDIFPGMSRRLYNRAKNGQAKTLKRATKIAVKMVGPEVRYWLDDIKRAPYWSQTPIAADISKAKAAEFLLTWVEGDKKIKMRTRHNVKRPKPFVNFCEILRVEMGKRRLREVA